jgi:hypothetical protein
VWPPFDTVANPDATCNTLGLLLDTWKTTTASTAKAYTARPARPSSLLQFKQFKSRTAPSNVTVPEQERDWVARGALWLSQRVLKLAGATPSGIYDFFVSLAYELLDAVHCDFEAVQTCSRWTVRLLNGIILVAVVQALVVLACFAVKLPMLGIASMALYVPAVLWTCYGYSPTCLPLVPSCIVRDIVETLQDYIPNYILLPPSMLRPGCVMTRDDLFVRDECIIPCDEPPFVFEDAGSVVAWLAAELRLVAWADKALENIPLDLLFDTAAFRAQMWLKLGVVQHGGGGLILGHRLCAAVSAYRLLPYLFLGGLFVATAVAVVLLCIDTGVAVGAVVASLAVTVFVE